MPEKTINVILVRIEGRERDSGGLLRELQEGYAENMKDGILAQGDSSGLDEFLSEVKNAPRPIIVDNMVPKKKSRSFLL